jgi:hypothetical protein
MRIRSERWLLSTWLILLCTLAACHSAPPRQLSREEFVCSIGATQVRVQVQEWTGSDLVFINLHDDENTSVEAGQLIIGQRGGRLVQLQHDGSRLISFVSEGTSFKFDPNRMFTDQGARRTLEKHGPFSEKALKDVRQFAASVLSICRFDELSLVATLHNNGDQGYSAVNYTKGAIYATDALKVYLDRDADPDDFFFVTDLGLFEFFQGRSFNVVLQDNENVTDDGSLSVLAGRRGIPYINVEAEEKHLQQQLEMLREVYAFYGN